MTLERRPYDLESLTDVAFRVFAARGFDRASMDDVAQAAGITKAAIYHHIAGKDALLGHGLARALGALDEILESDRARTGTSGERLRAIVHEVATVTFRLLPELTVLFRLRGNTEVERAALERRRTFDRAVARVARAAMDAGELPQSTDARLFTLLAFGLTNSVVEWYRPEGALTPEAIVDAVERMLFG